MLYKIENFDFIYDTINKYITDEKIILILNKIFTPITPKNFQNKNDDIFNICEIYNNLKFNNINKINDDCYIIYNNSFIDFIKFKNLYENILIDKNNLLIFYNISYDIKII